MATLSDVAGMAGVSPMTVSRVFSGRGQVSGAAREAVLAAADSLGYVPNEVARSLRNAKSSLVSLLVSDIGNTFFAAIAKRAEKALATAGYRVMIASSDEDAEQERSLLRGVSQMRAEGLVVVPTPHNGDLLERMRNDGLPIVQLDRVVDGLTAPAVLLDNAGATRLAVEHLAAAGHERIVLISGPQSLTTGRERAAGAERAAAAMGVHLDVVEVRSFMHEPSVDVARAAIALGPTAVVAGNNVVLEACMDAFARDGVRVPEDLALVGVDDLPWMSWVRPSLTAVRQPVDAMTDAAVAALLAQLAHEPPVAQVQRFEPTLVPRGSSVRA